MVSVLTSVDDVNKVVGDTSCRLVVIRFGDKEDPLCTHTDALLEKICPLLSNYVDIYVCERNSVKELEEVMRLDSPLNIMCFFNRRHIKIDCSSGDNDKINFLVENEEMLVEIFTLAYKAGVRGKGIIKSPFKVQELQGEL
ncbi:Dim1-like protein [Encephalitozoon intestinalis ATCC 50506]|uniref:Spliceosomal protein DIB1 n=1 Tax=Encephalitozoon intestinalis (strain ATCC 50506) TaxID=876142 RepID=E0S5Y5_ENCIT|nr:Dim1-like protein [Encephalitozoon intestinalis ATCC 50506]ADM11120.1 Dim1-like protein [Encephalitozoon intestinalis ATCC 50506]UTX44774.1 mitosis protein DIM1 [Encephalitozoon intestinalis]